MIQSDAEKAVAAQRLLQDPLLIGAFDAIEAEALEAITSSSPEEGLVREHSYYRIKAIEGVLGELKAHLTQHQLNERTNKR